MCISYPMGALVEGADVLIILIEAVLLACTERSTGNRGGGGGGGGGGADGGEDGGEDGGGGGNRRDGGDVWL